MSSTRFLPPNDSRHKNRDSQNGNHDGIREHSPAEQCVKEHEDHAEGDERNDGKQGVLWKPDALGQPGCHPFGDVTARPMQEDLCNHPPNGERTQQLNDGAAEQREPAVYSTTARS